jgi:hypothetical protein
LYPMDTSRFPKYGRAVVPPLSLWMWVVSTSKVNIFIRLLSFACYYVCDDSSHIVYDTF